MKTYTILFIYFLTLSGCSLINSQKNGSMINSQKKQYSILNSYDIPYRTLYEDRGLYPKGDPIIHYPDHIRFLSNGNYYILNDSGMNHQTDTLSEKGKYIYDKSLKRLSFFDREKIRDASEFVFDTNEDTINLEDVRITKDTLIFKFNKQDTLSFFFAKARYTK